MIGTTIQTNVLKAQDFRMRTLNLLVLPFDPDDMRAVVACVMKQATPVSPGSLLEPHTT